MDDGGFSMGSAQLKAQMALEEQKTQNTKGFQRALGAAAKKDPEEARRVAKDFEAVFLTTMISQMFKDVKVNERFGGGFGEKVWREHMFDEWGKKVAKNGGVGIADQIYRQVLQAEGKSPEEIARLMKEGASGVTRHPPRPSAETLAKAGYGDYAEKAEATRETAPSSVQAEAHAPEAKAYPARSAGFGQQHRLYDFEEGTIEQATSSMRGATNWDSSRQKSIPLESQERQTSQVRQTAQQVDHDHNAVLAAQEYRSAQRDPVSEDPNALDLSVLQAYAGQGRLGKGGR